MGSLAYPASDRDLIKRGLMTVAHGSDGLLLFIFLENRQPLENTCRPCRWINEQGCKLSHIQHEAEQKLSQQTPISEREPS